jgi:hypothetical protein
VTRCTRPCRRARRRPARDIRSCRIGRAPDQASQASRSRAVRSPHRRACRRLRPSGQPHRTGLAVGIGLRPWDDITLGDGDGQGERAPSRRYARPVTPRRFSVEARRSGRSGSPRSSARASKASRPPVLQRLAVRLGGVHRPHRRVIRRCSGRARQGLSGTDRAPDCPQWPKGGSQLPEGDR